jgi:hypothetical protein
MKTLTLILAALTLSATVAEAFDTTRCTTYGSVTRCTTSGGGGPIITTRCSTYGSVTRCSSY